MLIKNKFIKRSEDCILVKGYKKSIVYDLRREDYTILSQSQSKWFEEIDKKPIEAVNQLISKNKVYEDFVKDLFEQEFIFNCTKEELDYFPPLQKKWFHPSEINNILLFRSKKSNDGIFKVLDELEQLGLQHVQIFLEDQLDFDQVKKLIIRFSEIAIKSIEIFSTEDISEDFINNADNFIETQLITLTITNSKKFGLVKKSRKHPFNILFLKNPFKELFEKKAPDPNYFTVDIRLYMESQFHNTFFNKKLIIDSEDTILDHVNGNSFGKLKKGVLMNLLQSPEFKKLWNVKKDDISVCKDCEYRHMCVDSRKPIHVKGEWKFDTMCNYDPYSGKWNWEL